MVVGAPASNMLSQRRMSNSHHPSPLAGALVGAAGGLLGSWLMVRFNHAIGPRGGADQDQHRPHLHQRSHAQPNEWDGTIADEPASRRVASDVAEAVTGRPLTESQKDVGAPIAHYLFGAATGALYGALAEVKPETAAAMGLPFGATVWAAADEIGMPLLGLSESPAELPLSRHASALGSHLVFGLTVEAVRRMFRGASSSTTNDE